MHGSWLICICWHCVYRGHARVILTCGLLDVVPQFGLNEVFTVFRQSKGQAAGKTTLVRLMMEYYILIALLCFTWQILLAKAQTLLHEYIDVNLFILLTCIHQIWSVSVA